MNHSKAFWAVRNGYADEMRTLWSKSYTGEGLWGRGTSLRTGAFEANTVRPDEILPEHLCGGTYRSRRRKRKAKHELSYQEKKERRILKKFGKNGVALGEDEEVKAELENGRMTQSRPRVARSKRGRELRASAALARFDQQKKTDEDEAKVKVEDDDTASEYESETASEKEEGPEATGIDGKRILDQKGHGMVRVCGDESPEGDDARNELQELKSSIRQAKGPNLGSSSSPPNLHTTLSGKGTPENITNPDKATDLSLDKKGKMAAKESTHSSGVVSQGLGDSANGRDHGRVCSMCSFENGPVSLTCGVCSHVLIADKDPKSWKCERATCSGSRYLNAGDSGACGVCGERKATS